MITRREMLQYFAAAGVGSVACPGIGWPSLPKKKAMFWHSFGDAVACELCPHACILDEGKTGRCRTRRNIGNELITLAYSNPCALHVDPIEKKPFFHFLPGVRAYSMAIAGCNLRCLNCQNYTISQQGPDEAETRYLSPDMAVKEAKEQGCMAIACTYSEPTVWFEYMYDTAKKARGAGLKNVMVTSGFINEAPLRELSKYMDAVTLDVKSFSNDVYQKLNAGKLEPVLHSLETAKKCGMWIEVSNLIVPGWSDDPAMIRQLCAWIKGHLGADTPMHFLRFFPLYKLANLYPTPAETLLNAQKIAVKEGLRYAYVGNVAEADPNTYCPACKKALIVRDGYIIKSNSIKNAACPSCKTSIRGIW